MNKIVLFMSCVFLVNCSTGRKTSLNCEKLHLDSEARLVELKHIFDSYQGVNYDLAVKLSPPLKQEVADLNARVFKQKQKCWPSEKKPLEVETVLLKEELFKVYGDKEDEDKARALMVADVPKEKPKALPSTRKPASADDFAESVELDPE